MSTEQLIASYLRIANQDLKDALLLEVHKACEHDFVLEYGVSKAREGHLFTGK